MEIICIAFIVTISFILLLQAIPLYKKYKGSIYSYIYSGFFEYFQKMVIKKDLSYSNLLGKIFPQHKIIFHSILSNGNKKLLSFITIISSSGVFILCDFPFHGKITAKKNDNFWIINRDEKIYKVKNPIPYIQQFHKQLKNKISCDEIRFSLVIPEENEITIADKSICIIPYSKINHQLNEWKFHSKSLIDDEAIKTLAQKLL